MSARWDYLFDLRPVPLAAHLVTEVARLIADRLRAWPPPIEGWESARDRMRFEKLVAPGASRPDEAIFREAFRLARWEIANDFEAVDDYMRNERWRARIPPGGLDALVFISRYLTEELFALGEATEGRIRRRQLLECLDEAERRSFAGRIIAV